MCFKKLFPNWFKPDPIPEPITSKKTALLFAINDYPGSANDLNGCLNDQRDIANMLKTKFPGFDIRKIMDSDVTRNRFVTDVTTAISQLTAGDFLLIHYSGHGSQVYDKNGDEADGYDEALYLTDGTVIDDDIGKALQNIPEDATVVIMLDSCFSGTASRAKKNKIKAKYYQNPELPKRTIKRKRFKKEEMKWVVLSGCSENQTSADAYISGEYHGAFTWYAIKSLSPGMTYKEWIDKIHTFIPSKTYDQNPTLEGKESLLLKKVFT